MCVLYNVQAYEFLADYFDFSDKPNSFDIDKMYEVEISYSPINITDDKLYDKLINFLPENIEKQKEIIRLEQAEKERIDNIRKELENKELAENLYKVVYEYYNPDNDFAILKNKLDICDSIDVDKCYQGIAEIEVLLQRTNELSQKYIPQQIAFHLIERLSSAKKLLTNLLIIDANKLREKEYGTLDSLKQKLRVSINKLGFEELLDVYKDYKRFHSSILEKQANSDKIVAGSYEPYIDVYNYGAILISNKLNQLNRNKAKTKHIAPETLDAAMCFYYDTENIAEAYEIQKKERYSQDKESGNIGERKVEYTLQWLDKSNVSIEARSKNYAGAPCIKLLNTEFINKIQEYDHIIVGPKGVFIIETKNYAGKIIVDKYGNWIRKKHNEEIGMTNPLQQMRQHEKVLNSFLPNHVNIVSILCIANDKAIIEGSENFPMPIIKSDMIVEFLETYKGDITLSSEDIKICSNLIYEHMVS